MKKVKHSFTSLLTGLLIIILVASSCSKEGGGGGNGPSITSITPSSGLTGETITISGRNLAESTVTIGGIAVAVDQNTESTIVTDIPSGASTGQQEVKVTNAKGSATGKITVTGAGAPPVITSISPAEVEKGGSITITGTGLKNATVEIATKVSTVTNSTPTSITVTVPTVIALGSASVRVTTALGTTVSTVIIKE